MAEQVTEQLAEQLAGQLAEQLAGGLGVLAEQYSTFSLSLNWWASLSLGGNESGIFVLTNELIPSELCTIQATVTIPNDTLTQPI